MENEIQNNQQYGISLSYSDDNSIYKNAFIDNAEQAFSADSTSFWDNGQQDGGNYWSDYEEIYPQAEELDSSGFWNEPYQISDSVSDNYPLINHNLS